jgi:hypothetical protein
LNHGFSQSGIKAKAPNATLFLVFSRKAAYRECGRLRPLDFSIIEAAAKNEAFSHPWKILQAKRLIPHSFCRKQQLSCFEQYCVPWGRGEFSPALQCRIYMCKTG